MRVAKEDRGNAAKGFLVRDEGEFLENESKGNRKSTERGRMSEGPQCPQAALSGMTQAFLEWAVRIAPSVTQGTVVVYREDK